MSHVCQFTMLVTTVHHSSLLIFPSPALLLTITITLSHSACYVEITACMHVCMDEKSYLLIAPQHQHLPYRPAVDSTLDLRYYMFGFVACAFSLFLFGTARQRGD